VFEILILLYLYMFSLCSWTLNIYKNICKYNIDMYINYLTNVIFLIYLLSLSRSMCKYMQMCDKYNNKLSCWFKESFLHLLLWNAYIAESNPCYLASNAMYTVTLTYFHTQLECKISHSHAFLWFVASCCMQKLIIIFYVFVLHMYLCKSM